MTNAWFRMYAEVLHDPKVQSLSASDFKIWINLLCLSCKNGGNLPNFSEISFSLRIPAARIKSKIIELQHKGLVDSTDGSSDCFIMHSWNKRQYKSDVSTERVKRFRNHKETPPDTETDTEQREAKASTPIPPWVPIDAWNAWEAMRKKIPRSPYTDNARKLALSALEKLVNDGEDPRKIINEAILKSWKSFYAVKENNYGNSNQKPITRSKTTDSLDALLAAGDRFKRRQSMESAKSSGATEIVTISHPGDGEGAYPDSGNTNPLFTRADLNMPWKAASALSNDEHDHPRENNATGGLY